MHFLSYVAGLTKRKGDLLKEAKKVAEEAKNLEGLEKMMAKKSSSLVSSIREGKINSSELFRAVSDSTLVSSMAAVALGSKGSKPDKTMEDEFPYAVTRIAPLSQFQADFTYFKNSDNYEEEEEEDDLFIGAPGSYQLNPEGADVNELEKKAKKGDKKAKLALEVLEGKKTKQQALEELESEYYGIPKDEFVSENAKESSPPASWSGVESRVNRYIVSPIYGWHARGEMRKNVRLGYKEMRRITRGDNRVCPDCVGFGQQGWKPIGSLPSPGVDCRCYDRCRCIIEYR